MEPYKPILNYSPRLTSSFRIASLFYVALFGGAVALAVIGLMNAHMLRIKGKKLAMLWVVSIIFVTAKITYDALLLPIAFERDYRLIAPIIKLPDLLFFLFFHHSLKTPYRLHMIYNGTYHFLFHRGAAPIVGAVSAAIDFAIIMSAITR
ncbi:hypothetical protein [Paenibacillus sp. MMS18-CY102]|uniref:hypothetical protein n=1 Tax=Paenibacillus sp. MMS18-CY102 TaxID=2682849 RepID=UPI0013661278|nr:hypothetical protein [Paenibacillus sp. MMS18-CY102]MWC29291.1 hypothetical protein [Paenibacillus sp. MMS18-CY102]